MTWLRLGLIASLLAASGVWHLADKARGIDDALEVLRGEYASAALAASEAARTIERTLMTKNKKVTDDYQVEKTRRAADAVRTAGKLSELQAALDSAARADPAAGAGINGPAFAVAGECAANLVRLDEYAQGLASQTSGLQRYAREVCLATQ